MVGRRFQMYAIREKSPSDGDQAWRDVQGGIDWLLRDMSETRAEVEGQLSSCYAECADKNDTHDLQLHGLSLELDCSDLEVDLEIV